jgi:PQQ-dependent catabolism-associated CXXCW motif protein
LIRRRHFAFLAAAALAGFVLAEGVRAEGPSPPEPDGYRTGAQRAPTPATLSGARVLDLAGLEAMLAAGGALAPVLIDVGPADIKPANLPADSLWLPTHRSIPGAVWLPGAGLGDLPPDRESMLLDLVATLTGGDRGAPIVVFCKPDCWASWNLGRRLVLAGYGNVAWFPGGVDAWQDAHPTAPVDAMPGWDADPAPTPAG